MSFMSPIENLEEIACRNLAPFSSCWCLRVSWTPVQAVQSRPIIRVNGHVKDMEFRHFVQLIAIGLQARIPMHMTGFPGVGKTEFTKSLETGFARAGVKCKVFILIGSIREPQDFGGFPVSTQDGVRLLPMAWAHDARRLAEDGYMVVVFLDELTTVPPTTQAAMLRLLTENVCGELKLPDYEPGKGGVVFLCASNAVVWAAGGQEIQAPMANR
jgi:MoxR-like ATPase